MAATWVSLGAVLILLVMFAAALLPRPSAEYAISQAALASVVAGRTWRPRTTASATKARTTRTATNRVTSDEAAGPAGRRDRRSKNRPRPANQTGKSNQAGSEQGGKRRFKRLATGDVSDESTETESQSERRERNWQTHPADTTNHQMNRVQPKSPSKSSNLAATASPAPTISEEQTDGAADGSSMRRMFEHSQSLSPSQLLQSATSSLGNILKLVFYVVLGALIAYLAWTKPRIDRPRPLPISSAHCESFSHGYSAAARQPPRTEQTAPQHRRLAATHLRGIQRSLRQRPAPQICARRACALHLRSLRGLGRRSRPATHARSNPAGTGPQRPAAADAHV